MRSIYLAAGAIIGLTTFMGCGGDDKAPNGDSASGGTSAGGKGSGGKGSKPEPAGGEGGTSGENGPQIQVISPAASKSPADGVLTERALRVTCLAKSSDDGEDVDPSSVSVSVSDVDGTAVEQPASATANADEYDADVVIATLAPGKLTVTCQAKDRAGEVGRDSIASFLDRGPSITIVSPEANSAYPLKGGLDVTFTVEAVPLADEDPSSAVGEVRFSFDGKECVVGSDQCEISEVSPGKYHGRLALDDPNAFPAPTGAITIAASNVREPKPVVAEESYSISLDGDGPLIAIEAPAPQAVVGGKVRLIFTVSDEGSGVDESTVNVTLYAGGAQQFFDPNNGWSRAGNKFTYTFDTKLVEKFAATQTTLNVRASDKVGNPSASGQSVQIYLDNVPPKIDLDPRNIRVRAGAACSGSFDPVGSRPVNDLAGQQGTDQLGRFAWFRVFVDEQTNFETDQGQTLGYPAGTDQTSVRLYVLPDPDNQARKLLVNKNPEVDDTCDDIGGIDDVANPPAFSGMNPISTAGKVGDVWNKADPAVEPAVVANACTLAAGAEPAHLCPAHTSDMFYVPFNTPIKEPYIYVVGTPVSTNESCSGIDLNFLTGAQPDGWVCVAARVVDKAGNVGISPPLRLCVDDGEGTSPACRTSSTIPPSCTDGCTPPSRGGGINVVGQ